MKVKYVVAICLLILAFSGMSWAQWRFPGDAAPPDDYTPRSPNDSPDTLATREVSLPAFTRIRLYGQSNLIVTLGDEQSVKLEAFSKDLPALTAKVEDGVLIIAENAHPWRFSDSPTVYVTARGIDAICAYGSGAVQFLNKADGPLELVHAGTGEMRIAGRADLLSVTMKGSGDLNAASFAAGETSLQLSGSGDVHLDEVGGSLTLQSAGSGNVTVQRVRVVTLSVALNGSGKVTLVGTARQAAINVDASGEVDGRALQAEQAMVRLRGSGDVFLGVKRSLTATVFGSGNVTYYGDPPQLVVKTHGSGQVRQGN